MMSSIKTYSNHTYDLLMGDKHRIIKSILRQLFIGIFKEIEKNCYFDQENKDLITDFIEWPDDSKWDFNATAGMFNNWLFKNKTIDRVTNNDKKGLPFSLGDLEIKIQNPKFNIKLVEHRRIKKQLEVKKNFSFGFKKMSEVGAICRELSRMRNLSAHNDGLNDSSQALILLSNVLRLIEMIPDSIRESTLQFDYLEDFVKNEFLDSILSLKRPDIEDEIEELRQKLKDKNDNNKDENEKQLSEKLESISLKLTNLKELSNITNNLSDNQISVNQILSIVKESKQTSKQIHHIPIEELNNHAANNSVSSHKEGLSRSEIYSKLMELRLRIKKDLSPIYIGFRKEHNLLDEPLAKAIINEKLVTLKDLKASNTFKMKIKINKKNLKQPINKNDPTDYMNSQLNKYWPDIQLIMEDYFKNN